MDLITLKHAHGKAFTIKVRKHELICDMTRDDGGEDSGPSPAELFAASMAACIGMIAADYCRHHGLPSEDIMLNAVAQLTDRPKRVASIAIDLELPDGFPEDRKRAIVNAAKTCVIYNSLQNPPEVDLEIW